MAFHGVDGRGSSSWFVSPAAASGSDRVHQQQQQGIVSPWGMGGERQSTTLASRAPEPWMIRRDAVRAAERAAYEVALRVRPTQEAERRREDVVGYLRRLLGSTFGFEVFAFGSVPLRTYLPDGDVDITVLANTWLKRSLIDDVRHVLKIEMDNVDAEFPVKGLNFIDADVKLLKCVVDNIVVDISFNQIGGVSTFCFLEQVDRRVGNDHLFKRSIMLIKAWCYHESRILGAHHGLISTYAMETLVLYIFNLFHRSLHGPLEALYRFLEYFSRFDWDKYGVSLFGPVHLSALPDLTIESTVPEEELLLGHEFLHSLSDKVVVSGSNGRDTNFRPKFLNIIDPLKGNNNLGRSVSKGNFYRIQSALSFGAQKLGQILMLPPELIPGEICGFFANTLRRHGNGERPDLGDFSSFESLLAPSSSEHFSSLKLTSSSSSSYSQQQGDGHQDLPWNKIWFVEHASPELGLRASERMTSLLPPFSVSGMLDFSGDLDLHLGSLRKVQNHLEYMFEELQEEMTEAYFAGEMDEEVFKAPTTSASLVETRPKRITILPPPPPSAAGTDDETRNVSPEGYYYTEDVISHQQSQGVEDQVVDVVWQQPSGFSFSSSPVSATNPDSCPAVSWVPVSPKSHGTGTYIPKVSYSMYKERMGTDRGSTRRQQRPSRVAHHRPQHHTLDQWCATQARDRRGSSHDSDNSSSKSLLADQKEGGGGSRQLPAWEQTTATCFGSGTKPPSTDNNSSSSKGSSGVDTTSTNKEGQVKPLLHFGHQQGRHTSSGTCQASSSPSAASFCPLKVQVVENLEFGSMGHFSLGLLTAQFDQAFPPLPSSKKPEAQVVTAASTVQQSPEPVVTQNRPQDQAYQLRDEEFPPLNAACR